MNKQEKILLILFTLFFATLYFSSINFINLVVTGILFIYSMSLTTLQEKLRLLKERKFIQGAIVFFLFLVVSTILSENFDKGLHYLKLRIPLLLFPISIGLISLRTAFKEKVLLSFALTTVVVCFASLVYGIYNYTVKGQTDALYNDNLTSLLEQQSVYVAVMVNFAIFILGYLVVSKKAPKPFLLALGLLFLIFVAYLLGSRINLGVLALVTVSSGFYYLISNKKVLETATLCLGLLMASIVLYKVQPQMLERYKELAYSKYEFDHMGVESHYGMKLSEDQWNGANFRLAAWQCGWELFNEHPFVGVGLGDKKDALFAKYEQKNFRFA
ncbi:MAG: hypothetical protein LPK09_05180, partial [Hymenobacteraceae bacterium]|nr:hypothetical protein [Hymenobacteraceae bacterium]